MAMLGVALCVGNAVADEKPVASTSVDDTKASQRISPHILAAQRRAEAAHKDKQAEADHPREGLQSQMRKHAVKRHTASAR